MRSTRLPRTVSFGLVAVVLAVIATGCVRRRLMIRSNPVGALVYVDNVEVGTTPCAVDYTYYGTREIRLVKDGFETKTVNQPIPAPWYEIPPLDLISETMTLREIRDERTVSYNLAPKMIVPTDNLMARAEDLRRQSRGGTSFPVGSSAAIGVTRPGAVTLAPGGEEYLPPQTAPLGSPATQPGVHSIPPGGSAPVFLPPTR